MNSLEQDFNNNEWMQIEDQDNEAVFINLLKNGHAWTFFNGSHIWEAAYKESWMEDQILYKLISGVHTNINIHITKNAHDMDGNPIEPNHERYMERVGLYKERIENIFLTYSLVLKAVNNLSGKVQEYSYN